MIEVQMLSDIRSFEPKLVGPFTKRQVIVVGASLVVGVPLGFALPFDVSTNILVAFICVMPILLCGWTKIYGLHLEQFAVRWIYQKILTPPTRKYITKNVIHDEIKRLRKTEEEAYIQTLSKKEQKKYRKEHSNSKQVKINYGADTAFL